MRIDSGIVFARLFGLILAGCILFALPAHGVFLKKRFTVRQDRGRDVLCDSYVVQNNDYVIKLFQQRGEISRRDMPEFLEIFKRLNPEVRDVNLIFPDQRILIPLKIIAPNTLEGQSTGTVTIPLITITNVPRKLRQNAVEHVVVAGDSVSRLLSSRFGRFQSRSYKEAIEIFKFLNPDIKNLDLIRVGQKIDLPSPAIRDKAWYSDLFNQAGQIILSGEEHQKEKPPTPKAPKPAVEKKERSKKQAAKPVSGVPAPARRPHGLTVFEKAARILHADLMDRGEYFFPRKGKPDLRLDLSRTPVMELKSGDRLLFVYEKSISGYDQEVIRLFWKNLIVVRTMENASLRDLLTPICPVIHKGGCRNKLSFKDGGVSVDVRGDYIYNRIGGHGRECLTLIEGPDQATPTAIRGYLGEKGILVSEWIDSKGFFGPATGGGVQAANRTVPVIKAADPVGFIHRFAVALGCGFQEKVEVSFPYAGFQIKTLSNLLIRPSGQKVLIDFGDLYGDAVESIKTTGFHVVQIKKSADYTAMARELLNGLSIPYEVNPVFWAADRPRIHNTSIQVPGLLISPEKPGQKKVLLVAARINPKLPPFFARSGIRVVRIGR